jgi:molecular chaperone GrpE
MKESVPQEEELVGEEGADEVGDPATAAADEAESSDEISAGATRELEELNDRHLRLVAEFNNFRRRTEQERLSAWARAQADVVAKFLDVLDDLHRVAQLDLSNATVEAIMEGIDLVERKFTRMLEDSGVEVIDPAGQSFDPERMEAVMRVPAESDDQDDVVAQVFQKGYTLKGVLVRPARVSVFKQS